MKLFLITILFLGITLVQSAPNVFPRQDRTKSTAQNFKRDKKLDTNLDQDNSYNPLMPIQKTVNVSNTGFNTENGNTGRAHGKLTNNKVAIGTNRLSRNNMNINSAVYLNNNRKPILNKPYLKKPSYVRPILINNNNPGYGIRYNQGPGLNRPVIVNPYVSNNVYPINNYQNVVNNHVSSYVNNNYNNENDDAFDVPDNVSYDTADDVDDNIGDDVGYDSGNDVGDEVGDY